MPVLNLSDSQTLALGSSAVKAAYLGSELKHFNPKAISELEGWWDASDESTVTVSTGASEWSDKSGNARHATQETANNQPGYSNSQNGRKILTFDGSNDSLLTTSFTLSQPYSIFFVARRLGGGVTCLYHRPGTGPVLGTFGGVFYTGTDPYLNGPAADTVWHVFQSEYNGASSTFTVDGDVEASGDVGSDSISQGLRFGAVGDGASQYYNGHVAEVLLYSGSLSSADASSVLLYLQSKWGLA